VFDPPLTPATIAGHLERARVVACLPDGRRCVAWPNIKEYLVPNAAGWVIIGWVRDPEDDSTSWIARLHPATGEGRLRRWERTPGENGKWREVR
jgi:hypothetical protein